MSSDSLKWREYKEILNYHELSETDFMRCNVDNMKYYMKYVSFSPRATFQEDRNIARYETGIKHPIWNGVIRAWIKEDVDKVIDETLQGFLSKDLPGMTWFMSPADKPSNLGELLIEHGFRHTSNNPLMSVNLEIIEEIPRINGLEHKHVRSYEDAKAFYDVFKYGYTFPDHVYRDLCDIDFECGFDPESPRQSYIGYLDGEAASISTLMLGAGVAGIFNVATKDEFRRRGLATAMTLMPLHEARERGFSTGVLQSSQMANSLYERLGFKEDGKRDVYIYTKEEE